MFDGLIFRVAAGDQRRRAIALRRAVYLDERGHPGDEASDERADLLVAVDDADEIVACFRFLAPSARPFDFERYVDLATMIPADRSVAHVSRFCIRRDYRQVRRSAFVQIGMLKLACAFARKNAVTDLVSYTSDYLMVFYRGAFFDSLGPHFEHPDWGTQHLMRLDLLSLQSRRTDSKSPLMHLLFEDAPPNFEV